MNPGSSIAPNSVPAPTTALDRLSTLETRLNETIQILGWAQERISFLENALGTSTPQQAQKANY